MYTGRGNYQFIEANGRDGVRTVTYSEEFMKNENIFNMVYRVKGANKDRVVSFALSQVGKPFKPLHIKWNPKFDNDPNADKWYCTELIWAAYYNCGVDIDSNKGLFVLPFDIHTSPNIERHFLYI